MKLISFVKGIGNNTSVVDEDGGKWFLNDSPIFRPNFTCSFQDDSYNCAHFDNSTRHERCSMMRYFPHAQFMRIDPIFIFSKFNGSKIYFEGDSIIRQTFFNLACRLQPHLRNDTIISGGTSHGLRGGTFSFNQFSIDINYASSVDPLKSIFQSQLKPRDIYIFNHGLHLHTRDYSGLIKMIPTINTLRQFGVHVVWQETIAPQFLSTDNSGLWSREMEFTHANCVNIDLMNISAAWKKSTNAFTTPLMQKEGIPVLNIWNATFSAPAMCHVGKGSDCVHFCENGVLNYASDLLLHFLYNL